MMFEFTFLGTGAMKPTLKRFTSSLLIRYRGEVIMMDAGEGIQMRAYQSGFSPMKIDRIFITHFHGDHFYGLPGMIFTMAKSGRDRPLTIYGPRRAGEFVEQLLSVGYGRVPFKLNIEELSPGSTVEGDGYEVRAFRTDHGPPSLGYVFKEADSYNVDRAKMEEHGLKPHPKFRLLKEGKEIELKGMVLRPEEWLVPVPGDSLVYTGDTRPSPRVVEAAESATALVHESTYLHGDVQDDRGHSTAQEAAMIARDAGVKALFLTHISPRYRDASPLLEQARAIFANTYLPSDLTKVIVKKGEMEVSD